MTVNSQTTESPFAIAIHGGAGTILQENLTPEVEKAYREVLENSLKTGYAILESGGSSVEAVEAAIKIMEDSPLFNAGKGSVFTHDGKQEMDASIMDGKTLNAGAVAAVHTIRNPISAARLVMEKSPHVLLVGSGAEEFSINNGLQQESPEYFFNQFRFDQLQRMKKLDSIKMDHDVPGDPKGIKTAEGDEKFGTVGVVALDKNGNLAAGTSTGGMTNKRFGRVGDSPMIGAGTYANNQTCAISCTGHGEYFIRYVVAYDVHAIMQYDDLSLEDAAQSVINKKLVEAGGEGGLVGIDKEGNISMVFNTAGMYRGYIDKKGEIVVKIFRD